ncbi:uncharacterized protein [Hyperolius riggenbachi]|uniref:uncharacterized protein n=1 Tax=Hyperolius riggenbachi TaxID=752182 RepID=UPI0035A38D82
MAVVAGYCGYPTVTVPTPTVHDIPGNQERTELNSQEHQATNNTGEPHLGKSGTYNRIDITTISLYYPPTYGNYTTTGYFSALIGTPQDFCYGLMSPFGGIIIGAAEYCIRDGFRLYCNGPLLLPGGYRVIILVYRNGVLNGTSPWSDEFFLKNPQDYRSINTSSNTQNGSMIALTTILPILFAVALAFLTSALFLSCCCCSKVFAPTKCQQDC